MQTLKHRKFCFPKTLSYTRDKQGFSLINTWFSAIIMLAFIGFGGFGIVESFAQSLAKSFQVNIFSVSASNEPVLVGVLFFYVLMILSTLSSLPFEYYSTFYIEEKNGFNKQTTKVFFSIY